MSSVIDPVAEGYRRLRRLGELYVDTLNLRDRMVAETERWQMIQENIKSIEQSLEREEEALAHLLGMPCKHHWHPIAPRTHQRTATPSDQMTLEGV